MLKNKLSITILAILALAFTADIEQVCFPPGCEKIIIQQIDNAKTEIKIQAYSFTSAPISKALLNAHKRGIDVQIILDKSQRKHGYSSFIFFQNQSIPVFIDSAHTIAHNKVIIIDREMVITGSFNFTKAAEYKNAENVLFIKSKELAQRYLDNWKRHKEHAE
jgi:phosphatidylserine/phosphatidylglycerophosphate/cardiolipin synthase-like enzyme